MDSQSYRRWSATQCWISHILEGKYSEENKTLFTIFGETKRVRLAATIVRKTEKIITPVSNDENEIQDEIDHNIRMEFELDDGSGVIRAVIWNANPEDYNIFKEGDLVDIVGVIQYWNGYSYIRPEIMKKVKDPNLLLLRNAEILKKIKSGDITEIPEIDEYYDNVDDIDVEQLFVDEKSFDANDTKNLVYNLIEEHEEGISFKDLNAKLKIPINELKNILRDLEMESMIYQSDEDLYQSY
ncbi:MAG: OB-fold nucleic acid binding domain-containing protein [Promethearchaeota archaeon]